MSSPFLVALNADLEAGAGLHNKGGGRRSSSTEAEVVSSELDELVQSQKHKIGYSVVFFTVVEVIISCFSIEKLSGKNELFQVLCLEWRRRFYNI